MLDQNAAETFEGTERRPMDHHGPPRGIVRCDIGESEPLGQVIIHLHGSELPLPPDHVFNNKINLWTVKRRFAAFFGKGHSERLDAFAKSFLRSVPLFGG